MARSLLLIDDDALVARHLTRTLERTREFDVTSVATLEAGLGLLASRSVDCVLLETREPRFAVDGAGTGEAALAIVGREDAARRPEFVVLDFHLPDVDAPEALARIRRTPGGAELPVLVLTQADWRDDEAAALAAGARAFRAKPSTLAELRAVVVDFWVEHVRDRQSRSGAPSGKNGR